MNTPWSGIPVTDTFSITAGVNNGWDNNSDTNHGYSYEGQVAWEPSDDFFLAVNAIWGPERVGEEDHKRGVVDVVATWKPTDSLTLVGNFDWGHEGGVRFDREDVVYALVDGEITPVSDFRTRHATAVWWGAALVADYQFTDRFGLAVRGEYFEDSDGFRTGRTQKLRSTP